MKATELMIGDWILYGDKPVKVLQLSENSKYDWAKPIPLTPEILEKNGWQHSYEENRCGTLHKWHKEDVFKQFTVWKNKGRFELGELGCFPFKYLHELQDALRLCGLDDFADNFKV